MDVYESDNTSPSSEASSLDHDGLARLGIMPREITYVNVANPRRPGCPRYTLRHETIYVNNGRVLSTFFLSRALYHSPEALSDY